MDKRFEILMKPDMRQAMDRAAQIHRMKPSTWVRFLIAQELTRQFGSQWINVSLDHPEGDQG